MPLSSMLSKVSKEMSNYTMDSDGNIKKKKQDPQPEQSYGSGGSYGYSHGNYPSNTLGPNHGNPSNCGFSDAGSSSVGPHMSGGQDGKADGGYGPPPYEEHYHPAPPGPLPGQYLDQTMYGPPPGAPPKGAPPGAYNTYPSSQFNPPSGPPPSLSRLPFNPKMEMWCEYSDDGNTYFCLGERKGTTVFSAKMPMVTGNLVVNHGGRKSPSGLLGEAKDSGISRSSAVITLPEGFSCNLSKNSMKNLGEKSYAFTVPTDGGQKETFVWKKDEQGLKSMMKGQPTGWSLTRDKGDGQPLAKFTDDDDMLGMSSKSKMGHLEFVGDGASGTLGRTWATVVVIAIIKAKAKELEKTIIKEVLGAI